MNQADRRAVDTLTDAERMSARAADQIGTARLIDSHVHIWDPRVLEYSWLEGELNRPYLPAEYQAGAPATTGVVFVEEGPVGKADEVALAESLGWPALLGVVAHAPWRRAAESWRSWRRCERRVAQSASAVCCRMNRCRSSRIPLRSRACARSLQQGCRSLRASGTTSLLLLPRSLLGFRSCQLCSITSPSRRLQAVTTEPGSGTYER